MSDADITTYQHPLHYRPVLQRFTDPTSHPSSKLNLCLLLLGHENAMDQRPDSRRCVEIMLDFGIVTVQVLCKDSKEEKYVLVLVVR